MALVEHRYAEALIDMACEKGLLDEYRKQLGDISGIYARNPDLKPFLLNPGIKADIKKDLLGKALRERINNELLHFLFLLVDKKRIDLLSGIFFEFCRLADRLNNVLHIEIIGAKPLDGSQAEEIKQIYMKEYGASRVDAEIKTDPSLIGGVMVKIGDKLIDGTVKGRLERLKESVMEA